MNFLEIICTRKCSVVAGKMHFDIKFVETYTKGLTIPLLVLSTWQGSDEHVLRYSLFFHYEFM